MNRVLLALILVSGLASPISSAERNPVCDLTKVLFTDSYVQENKMPAFILFSEPSCSACRKAKPIIAKMKKKFKDKIHFYTISGEEDNTNYWFGNCFNIRRIPTAILYVIPVLETGKILTPSILLNERLLEKILKETISLRP